MHSVAPFSFHLWVLPLKVSPSSSSIFYQLECQGATIMLRQWWYQHSIAIHAHSFLVSNVIWQRKWTNHFKEPIHEPRLWFATRWQKPIPIFQSPKECWLSIEMVHCFCSIFYHSSFLPHLFYASLEMQGPQTSCILPHTLRNNGIARSRDYSWDIFMVESRNQSPC